MAIASTSSSGRQTPSTPRATNASSSRLSSASAASSAGPSTPRGSRLTAPTRASAARMLANKTTASQRSAATPRAKAASKTTATPASSAPPSAIQAYLRIRPSPEDGSKDLAEPYISVVDDNKVVMTPPDNPLRSRSATPCEYTFARVFGPHDAEGNSQTSFFRQTTLPMVAELLNGESGLIFTYGVTNSGKSYTVQGGSAAGEAGLLPRALDVVFNSIQGLESQSSIAPLGLYGVERVDPTASSTPAPLDPWNVPSLKGRLAEASRRHVTPTTYQRETEKVRVDRNYRYSVWASYVEVYNEKLYDLLDVGGGAPSSSGGGMTRSDSVRGSNWSIAGLASSNDLAGALTLNRRPLHLKTDPEGSGKYVAGLQEVRVKDASDARELLRRGQENRIVFSTMANRSSSRSHGVFTIKVVREHAGSGPDDSLACTVSRLSIVDLAGSERISNTSTSGQRQKEAGSINKSLMCLGQCLETLRKNQARAASMIPMLNPISSLNPRAAAASSTKRRPSVVPFRHSKLTELFQPFFTGEGRTVMIVNANPYDTGFDENSHVMRFSAVAKEVQTLRGINETRSVSRIVRAPSTNLPFPTASGEGGGADITIVEESDDENDDGDEDASGSDGESTALVDLLIARHEELRERLYEAELRAATMEQTVREEMAAEMAERLAEMEARYTQRLLSDVERNEDFFNRKIDLLVNATSGATGARKAAKQEEQEVEESVGAEEESLVTANESTALSAVDESTTSDNSVSLQPGPFEKVAKRGVAEEEDSDVEEDEGEEEDEEADEDAEDEEEEESEEEEEESVEEEDDDSSYAAEESIDSPPPPPRRRSTLTTARKSNPLGPRTSVNVATTPKQLSASNLRPKGKSSTMSRLDESASDDDLLIPSPSKSSLAATPRASTASTSSASPRKRRTLRSGRAIDEEEIEARVARI